MELVKTKLEQEQLNRDVAEVSMASIQNHHNVKTLQLNMHHNHDHHHYRKHQDGHRAMMTTRYMTYNRTKAGLL